MNRTYQVQITARAERDLDRLPEKIAGACVELIFGPLAENPARLGKQLRNELTGLRCARRGDYRILEPTRASLRSEWSAARRLSQRAAAGLFRAVTQLSTGVRAA